MSRGGQRRYRIIASVAALLVFQLFAFSAQAFTGTATASAAVATSTIREPRFRIGMDAGAGSAVGTVGVVLDLALISWLQLEAGIGYGHSGIQLEMMPKLSFGSSARFSTGVGVALAVGGPNWPSPGEDALQPTVIPWINIDAIGFEYRWPAGFSIRTSFGVAIPQKRYTDAAAVYGITREAGEIITQGRVGFGFWF